MFTRGYLTLEEWYDSRILDSILGSRWEFAVVSTNSSAKASPTPHFHPSLIPSAPSLATSPWSSREHSSPWDPHSSSFPCPTYQLSLCSTLLVPFYFPQICSYPLCIQFRHLSRSCCQAPVLSSGTQIKPSLQHPRAAIAGKVLFGRQLEHAQGRWNLQEILLLKSKVSLLSMC